MPYKDNIAEVMRGFDRLENDLKTQTLTIENNMEYALHLQNKEGYYVINEERNLEVVVDDLKELSAALPLTGGNVALSLERSGFDIIAFERSLTAKLRPPTRKVDGMRQAHPGGWADITGNLASAFRFRVNNGPNKGEQ